MNRRGKLITVEGIDGCGKSTLVTAICKKLTTDNIACVQTKEPGGTKLGQNLVKILHTNKQDLCDLAEYLLFAAARAQHFEQLIVPALEKGSIVVSDRMADSSMAYQGYGRGLNTELIGQVNAWAMQEITPDLVLYVKLDWHSARERVTKRNLDFTTFEKEEIDFWDRVRQGYDKAFANRDEVVTLDGTLSAEDLCAAAIEVIKTRFG